VAFRFRALVTGLPANDGDGWIHRALHRLSQPVCRFFGGCSRRVSAVFADWPEFFQQPVHHWHPSNSNRYAVLIAIYFQRLASACNGKSF
jgi:hypothetical protein